MIPLRYLAADLDAQLKWDAAGKRITVTDDIYGTTIVLRAGSKDAFVDGVKVKLSEALHAQVIADGEGRIYITRD